MPTSNFKLFDENKANMLSDSEYNSNAQRLNGVQSGVASSQLQNKFQYQASLMAYAIAQLMVQNGYDATDTTAVTTFISNLSNTMLQKVADKANETQAKAGTDNTKWMTPALVKSAINELAPMVSDILSNETKALYGLDDSATPDDAFNLLSESIFKVGDIRDSARTSIGENWLPCDGSIQSGEDYPYLAAILGVSGFAMKVLDTSPITDYVSYSLTAFSSYTEVNGYQIFSGVYSNAACIYYKLKTEQTWKQKLFTSVGSYGGCKVIKVLYGGGYYVVLYSYNYTYAAVQYTTDLDGDWTDKGNVSFSNSTYADIEFHDGTFVVAYNGSGNDHGVLSFTTSDMSKNTLATVYSYSSSAIYSVKKIKYVNGTWILLGMSQNAGFHYSTDLKTWSHNTSILNVGSDQQYRPMDVIWDGTQYLVTFVSKLVSSSTLNGTFTEIANFAVTYICGMYKYGEMYYVYGVGNNYELFVFYGTNPAQLGYSGLGITCNNSSFSIADYAFNFPNVYMYDMANAIVPYSIKSGTTYACAKSDLKIIQSPFILPNITVDKATAFIKAK